MSIRTEQFKFTNLQNLLSEMFLRTCAQGEPSGNKANCYYRSKGTKGQDVACALGQLMTDEEAASLGETYNGSASYFSEVRAITRGWGIESGSSGEKLIREMQSCHDDAADDGPEGFVETFRNNVAEMVDRFNACHGQTLVVPSWPSTADQASAPIRTPKRVPRRIRNDKPGSVRHTAQKLREAAKLLESDDVNHVAFFQKLTPEDSGLDKPCFCAIGAFKEVGGSFGTFKQHQIDNIGAVVAETAIEIDGPTDTHGRKRSPSYSTIIGFNDNFSHRAKANARLSGPMEGEVAAILNDTDSATVCRFLRTLARKLEHGALGRNKESK